MLSRGDWRSNVSVKAPFVRHMMECLDRPLLWIDADAVVHQSLEIFEGADFDFAVYRREHHHPFFGGLVFFNNTVGGKELLRAWAAAVEEHPDVSDQPPLYRCWKARRDGLETRFLDRRYAKKVDDTWPADPFVVHRQASRFMRDALA